MLLIKSAQLYEAPVRGQPGCPGESFPAGYVLGVWRKFQPLCLSMLSQEDAEDIYLFRIMVIRFLLIGTGSCWIYHKMEQHRTTMEQQRSETWSRLETVLEVIGRLKEQLDALIHADGTENQLLSKLGHRQDGDLAGALGLIRNLSSDLEKLLVRIGAAGN